ncbi:serine hydrolase domain-containing protein [Pyruvatibacter mobilis]|uniref:serine hydrolase domain-containing protein n=1 Tax=Pyruvatibacter mobilis TaxID=1712261 RepID=UPI003BAFE1E1
MKKLLLGGAALLLAAGAAGYVFFGSNIDRATTVATLFTGEEQYQNFHRMDDMFPVNRLPASDRPYDFPDGDKITLPATFTYKGETVDTEKFIELTDTGALLVLRDGKVIYENYWLTGGREEQWLSMSVAKSFISTLVGIAVEEGHIESIEQPVTAYLPDLAGSAYDGVRIKDILQMSSGAAWNEDYSDPDSDINRFGRIFALGGSLNDFMATLEREREPGTYNHYNSTDTQVLGALVVAATGRSIADYMTEKLWQPLGAESDAFWLTDDEGMEMAFGGFNATARDYAKLGELFRKGGEWRGEQLVPADWAKAAVTPDAPHLLPEAENGIPFPLGYGYQWWVLDSTEGEFSGIGVYNQFVYVNPAKDVTIVKLSAFSDYAKDLEQTSYREEETFEMFRAIVDSL